MVLGYILIRECMLWIIFFETRLSGFKLAITPIEETNHLTTVTGFFFLANSGMISSISGPINLSITRPKLAYSVYVLTQFINKSRQEHCGVCGLFLLEFMFEKDTIYVILGILIK